MAGIVNPSGDVMQHSPSHPTPAGTRVDFRRLRLLAASAALALAGGLMQTAAAAPHGVRGGPGTPPAMGQMGSLLMAHPRQMERLFDGIGASAEQRAQIQQIAQAARADLRAQREAGREARARPGAVGVAGRRRSGGRGPAAASASAQARPPHRRMVPGLLDVGTACSPRTAPGPGQADPQASCHLSSATARNRRLPQPRSAERSAPAARLSKAQGLGLADDRTPACDVAKRLLVDDDRD